jgi:uncharacterized protein YjiS (DUF1127 family)
LYRQGGTATQPSADEIRLLKTRAALTALQSYAHALTALEQFSDKAQALDAAFTAGAAPKATAAKSKSATGKSGS